MTDHAYKILQLCNNWEKLSEEEKDGLDERYICGKLNYIGAIAEVKEAWGEQAERFKTRRKERFDNFKISTNPNEWGKVWFTTDEVATLLGATRGTVYQMARNGEIAGRRCGNRLLIPAKAMWERVHPAPLPQQTAKPKGQSEASPEEQAERASEMRTQGRKGCKAARINMAFAPENHEFIKVMARASGRTMTEFANLVIGAYRKEHPELMAAASTFLDVINSGTFSALPADELDEDEPEANETETVYEQTTLPTNIGNACAVEAPTERQRKFIWCIEQILPVRFCGETRYDAWLWIRNHISEFKAASDESKER